MKKVLSLALFAVLSVFSVATLAEDQAATSTAGQAMASDPLAAKKDGVILQTIMNIDNNEINSSQLAEKKTANTDVKNFAQAMIAGHSKNLQDAKDLANKIHVTPVSTAKTDRLQKMGQDELKQLDAVDSQKFDVTYVDAMVKGHQKALKIIDDKLLPKATNPELIAFLKSTREAVSHHLQMAQDVQKKLK